MATTSESIDRDVCLAQSTRIPSGTGRDASAEHLQTDDANGGLEGDERYVPIGVFPDAVILSRTELVEPIYE